MPISLHNASIPVFIRGLSNLKFILQKGKDYAKEKSIDPKELLEVRLIEDMAALPFQVQRVCDAAKFAYERITGAESRSFPDDEVTFDDLQARISKTIEYLKEAKESQFAGADEREIALKVRGNDIKFTAADYLFDFAIPNFFFHITTAYALLRMKGVPVGKMDYLNGAQMTKTE